MFLFTSGDEIIPLLPAAEEKLQNAAKLPSRSVRTAPEKARKQVFRELDQIAKVKNK